MSKICVICKEKIIDTKERWVRLTDFNRRQQVGETFYHLECWRDRFKVSNSLRKQKMYNQVQDAIRSITDSLKKFDIGSEKVYEIPAN